MLEPNLRNAKDSFASLQQSLKLGNIASLHIAPTILHALGLDPDALDGVRKEHTDILRVPEKHGS
jgi:hypothetical protein